MDWIVAQLSGWARSKISLEEIKSAITNVLSQDPLYIYIPIYEDPFGKKDTGFGEYVFINYDPSMDYYILEDLDVIVRIIKEPYTKRLQFLSNDEVWEIKRKADLEVKLSKEDVVKIITGPLRNNYGVIQFVLDDSVNVIVYVGQETVQVTLPVQHIRKSSKRTILRKKELESARFQLSDENGDELRSNLNFGEIPRLQILRRGLRKTKISIDNKVYQIQNDVIDQILLSSDIFDDKFIDQVNKAVLSERTENVFEE